MERSLFQPYHASESVPRWRCTRRACKEGRLFPKTKGAHYATSFESEQIQHPGQDDPRNEFGRYSMVLQCSSCADMVIVVGEYGTEDWETADGDTLVDFLSPKFVLPAVPLIEIPTTCPANVRDSLIDAFSAYWSSPKNAANSIRIALEHLMDEQQVPEARLHNRIETFGKIRPDTHDFLEAAKWVGNEGSHKGEMTHRRVLDILEMIEHALDVLYPKDLSELRKKAQAINKASRKTN